MSSNFMSNTALMAYNNNTPHIEINGNVSLINDKLINTTYFEQKWWLYKINIKYCQIEVSRAPVKVNRSFCNTIMDQ